MHYIISCCTRQVLNLLSRLFGYRRYLEIGIDDGLNFAAVRVTEEKVGVDPGGGGGGGGEGEGVSG